MTSKVTIHHVLCFGASQSLPVSGKDAFFWNSLGTGNVFQFSFSYQSYIGFSQATHSHIFWRSANEGNKGPEGISNFLSQNNSGSGNEHLSCRIRWHISFKVLEVSCCFQFVRFIPLNRSGALMKQGGAETDLILAKFHDLYSIPILLDLTAAFSTLTTSLFMTSSPLWVLI